MQDREFGSYCSVIHRNGRIFHLKTAGRAPCLYIIVGCVQRPTVSLSLVSKNVEPAGTASPPTSAKLNLHFLDPIFKFPEEILAARRALHCLHDHCCQG